jgi:2-methylcitrate dehydratase PrpD
MNGSPSPAAIDVKPPDAVNALVDFAASLKFNALPEPVVNFLKFQIIDSIGVMCAGSAALGCRDVVDEISAWGGREEATIPIFHGKTTAQNATLARSMMTRALDYDDIHDDALGHPSGTTVPVAFPVAEWTGGVSGKDLIAAIAVGNEIFVRLGMASTDDLHVAGMSHTAQAGIFAGAATASRVARLSRDQLHNALGIAQAMVSGTLQNVNEGVLSVRVGQGLMSHEAVLATRFAKIGITGAREVLEGRFGYFPSYHRGIYERGPLVEGLGEQYHLLDTSFKPYPCGHLTHVAVEAGVALHEARGGRAPVSILLRTNEMAFGVLAPNSKRRREPATAVDAQFSMPWAFAAGFVRGKAGIDEFSPEAVASSDLRQIAAMTEVVVDPELEAEFEARPSPLIAVITYDDGEVREARVDIAAGHQDRPLTHEQVRAKFLDCCAHAATPIGRAAELLERLGSLEDEPDVSALLTLL